MGVGTGASRAHFRLRHPRQQSFSISGASERGWRFRLQKLEDLRPPASTEVERVYTEKKIDTQKVYLKVDESGTTWKMGGESRRQRGTIKFAFFFE